MRPPSQRLAPQGQNHQAAPQRPLGGGIRGPGDPALSPPPSPWADGGWPERRRPRTPPGGPLHPGGGGGTTAAASAAARQAPPVDGLLTPALPAADRQQNGGTQECANEAAHSGAGLGKAGEPNRARTPLPPPPRHTDPPAADRAAPGAHGRPATPTACVYPRGARRRQKVTGTGATGHPTGQGERGSAARPPLLPPLPPASPPACGPRGRRPSAPPGAKGTTPLPQKGP